MSDAQNGLISMADIARLAGTSRAVVGNWKARNPEAFPTERGKGPRGPLYDRPEVTEWLKATDRLKPQHSEVAILWSLADRFRGSLATDEFVPLVLALLFVMMRDPETWIRLETAPPADLDALLRGAINARVPDAMSALPVQEAPTAATQDAIRILSQVGAADTTALADAALEYAAQAAGHRGGEFLSPPSIRKLVVALADPTGTIYNPATGAGQLLADAASVAGSTKLKLVGQEINARARAISLLNLSLRNLEADVALGDVFGNDQCPQLRADRVISMPPWSARYPVLDELRDDPRWIFGEPGPSDGNAAWIQHCLAHLAVDGRAVMVMPNGVLFESGRGGRIRPRLIKAGLLDAVVALPGGLFEWTVLPCTVLVLRKGRQQVDGMPPSTLMMDLSSFEQSSGRAKTLSDRSIATAAAIYLAWLGGQSPSASFASVATYDEIVANDFIIDPSRYLAVPASSIDHESVETERRRIAQTVATMSATITSLDRLVGEGHASTVSTFTEARLGDLIPNTLTIARGFPTQRAVRDEGTQVLSIAAVRSGASPRHFADPADLADLGIDVIQPGDVLVSVEGGTVGEVLIVTDEMAPFVASQQVATLRVSDLDRLDPWYLGAWLSSPIASEHLRRLARGAAIQRIAIKDLDSMPLNLPPLQTQREIGARFQTLNTAERAHRLMSASLEALRDLELSLAFTPRDAPRGGQA
jgi:hypothetical protein